MELPSYFKDFLKEIRPTQNQRDEMKTGHTTLRDRLRNYESLKGIYVSDFLQGSYRRSTAVRPKADKRSDVDVIVVTNLHEDDYTPKQAMDLFKPFLDEYYKGKWEFQGRSMGISLSYVDLDLVITSAPSEAEAEKLQSKSVRYIGDVESAPDWILSRDWVPSEERYSLAEQFYAKNASLINPWKLEPLRIPDRDANEWDDTHPLEQISRTTAKNRVCNAHYINVVKALKWWRRINTDNLPKYPKGYPLEHLIYDCCPDGIASVAQGVTLTLEEIVRKYEWYASNETTPFLPDHGVPNHNVFHRVTGEDFAEFYEGIKDAAQTARKALDEDNKSKSVEEWRKLFGNKFPKDNSNDSGGGDDTNSKAARQSGGYSNPQRPGSIGEGTFG